MELDWEPRARHLANRVVRPESRWWAPIATTPRHVFFPRWWAWGPGGRAVRDGQDDPEAWLKTAYRDDTVVTRLGTVHADLTTPGTVLSGRWPTSSSTLPTLMVTMYRHALLADRCRTLVTCGTGYGTALLCRRLGAEFVTSVDVDAYLVQAATERLSSLGLYPGTAVTDLTGPLDVEVDRIVSTVSVRPIPSSWLTTLSARGRMVAPIAGTGLLLVADKTEDGGATGHIVHDPVSFMRTRHGDDHDAPQPGADVWKAADGDGDTVTSGRYPLLNVSDSWEVSSMLELSSPGIEHRKDLSGDGLTTWMAHPDGSWARATATGTYTSPTVHQGGPRRLWDDLEAIRDRLNTTGWLPAYGARATITPDGVTTLSRGNWSVTL